MPNIRAQVILATADGIPENFVSNTLSFEVAALSTYETPITTAIKAFYDQIRPWLSPAIAQTGHRIKFVDRASLPPQYPYAETTWAFDVAPAGNRLPREVAIVGSFQADRVSGLPQSRRRGRLYLGPLNTLSISTGGNPIASFRQDIADALEDFKTAIDAIPLAGEVIWEVWSGVNQTGALITNGWVDDAWDTQRSRGESASSRITW